MVTFGILQYMANGEHENREVSLQTSYANPPSTRDGYPDSPLMETDNLQHMTPFQFHRKRLSLLKYMNVWRAISHACPNNYLYSCSSIF